MIVYMIYCLQTFPLQSAFEELICATRFIILFIASSFFSWGNEWPCIETYALLRVSTISRSSSFWGTIWQFLNERTATDTRSITFSMVNNILVKLEHRTHHFLASFLASGFRSIFTTALPSEQFVNCHARNRDEVQRDGYGMVVSVRLLHDSELEAPLRQSVILWRPNTKRSGWKMNISSYSMI